MMAHLEILKAQIRDKYKCTATHHVRERIWLTSRGETVWHGEVHVFLLKGHPEHDRCFAFRIDRSDEHDTGNGENCIAPATPTRTTAEQAVRDYLARSMTEG